MRGYLPFVLAVIALGLLAPSMGSAASEPSAWGQFLVPPPHSSPNPTTRQPAPVPNDAPFGPNVQVSEADTAGSQNEITMAVASDGRIHMGWNDIRDPNPDYRCGYSYSTDGGLTWSPNRLLHLDPWQADGDPMVIVDSNDVVYFVCMPFNRTSGGSRIVVYKSVNGGLTFAPPVIASDTTLGFNDKPWAHAVGTTLHLCYANFVGGGSELRYTRSTDGGQTWAPTRVLDRNGNGCVFASTAAGMLYLSWVRGSSILAFASSDGGTTWSVPRFAGPAPFTGAGDQRAGPLPAIAADWNGGNVYVVWTADDGLGAWDVFVARSTDRGVTWSAPVTPSDDTTGRQFMPGIDVDASGTVHVSWYDSRSGLMTYRNAASTDGGRTWLPSVRVTDTEWTTQFFIGDYTTLVADDLGYVNCGWADARSGEVEAYFARSAWPGPRRLARLAVSPPEASTDADSPILFTATGYDQVGDVYPTNPVWEATGGTILGGAYIPRQAGDWRVWANESGLSATAIVHVTPGAVARIDVSPETATLTADETVLFSAAGYDAHDNVVPILPVWTSTNGSVSGGAFAPYRTGTWIVYANQSGVSGASLVHVLPGALSRIDVSPATASLTADETILFSATGYDAHENTVTVTPVWTATDGAVVNGVFSPSRAGTWTVSASQGGIFRSASVTVVAGTLAAIDITPALPAITADDVLDFDATGRDAKGNPVSVSPVWSAGGGSIDSEGRYAAKLVGSWPIAAEDSGVSGVAHVTVTAGGLARIQVSPGNPVITADQILILAASGFDSDGNAVSISPAWSADAGTVSSAGVYSPSPIGTYHVRASVGGIAGEATVTVLPGALIRIDVSPPESSISADDSLTFTAAGYDGKGNPVAATFRWTASCGTVLPTGHFTPSVTGVCVVHADSLGIVGSASITVVPGALVRLDVSPSAITITADETAQFSVLGFDAKGNRVSVAPSWGADAGTLDASGLYTASLGGTWEVRATVGNVASIASITVVPGALDRLLLVPDSVTMRADETATFSVVGLDRAGNEVSLGPIVWAVTNGTIENGRFEPWRTGNQQISATLGAETAVATATIGPGAVASVVLSPVDVTVREGEERVFVVQAYDSRGNSVSDAEVLWMVEGGIGTVDAQGRFTATVGGTGRVVAVVTGGGGTATAKARVDVPSFPVYAALGVGALVGISLVAIAWRRRNARRGPE